MSRTKFTLPAYIGTRNLDPLFQVCAEINQSEGDIEIDASHVGFIDPMGLTVLTALLSPLCVTRAVRLCWLSVNIASYLDRMDFFRHCPVEGVEIVDRVIRSDLRRSLVEITTVSNAHETDATASRLATALTGNLTGLRPEEVSFHNAQDRFQTYCHPIEYALTELLDNSLTHARREGRGDAAVWVAAQYYTEDLVRIGIVDNGCGFLATLSSHPELPERSHLCAIEFALRPFISCNRRDLGMYNETTNEGVGLTTTRRISETAGGGMAIVSGDARFTTGNGGHCFKNGGYWPGVAISFVCKREMLPLAKPSRLLPELPKGDSPAPELRFSS